MSVAVRLKSLGSRVLTSSALLEARRAFRSAGHRLGRTEPELHLFIDFANPYVPMAWQAARSIVSRHSIAFIPVITAPTANAAQDPQRTLKGPYFLKDAARVAKFHAVPFAAETLPSEPSSRYLLRAAAYASDEDRLSAFIQAALDKIWSRGEPADTQRAIESLALDAGLDPARLWSAANDPANDSFALDGRKLLEELGHYDTAMFELDGEWFWGVDRLDFLSERLRALGR